MKPPLFDQGLSIHNHRVHNRELRLLRGCVIESEELGRPRHNCCIFQRTVCNGIAGEFADRFLGLTEIDQVTDKNMRSGLRLVFPQTAGCNRYAFYPVVLKRYVPVDSLQVSNESPAWQVPSPTGILESASTEEFVTEQFEKTPSPPLFETYPINGATFWAPPVTSTFATWQLVTVRRRNGPRVHPNANHRSPLRLWSGFSTFP